MCSDTTAHNGITTLMFFPMCPSTHRRCVYTFYVVDHCTHLHRSVYMQARQPAVPMDSDTLTEIQDDL